VLSGMGSLILKGAEKREKGKGKRKK